MTEETRFYQATRLAREEFKRTGEQETYLKACLHVAILLAAEEIADVNERLRDLPTRIHDAETAINQAVVAQRHLMSTDHDENTHHHDVLEEYSDHIRSQGNNALEAVVDILDALEL